MCESLGKVEEQVALEVGQLCRKHNAAARNGRCGLSRAVEGAPGPSGFCSLPNLKKGAESQLVTHKPRANTQDPAACQQDGSTVRARDQRTGTEVPTSV